MPRFKRIMLARMLLAAACGGWTVPVWAQIPIYETGKVITQGGNYLVTRDLGPNSSGGSVIEINAPGERVNISLGNFSTSGGTALDNSGNNAPVIHVIAGTVSIVGAFPQGPGGSLPAASLIGGTNGVLAEPGSVVSVGRVLVTNPTGNALQGVQRISNVELEKCGDAAVQITGDGSTPASVTNSTVQDCQIGIVMEGASSSRIQGNTFENTPTAAIDVQNSTDLIIAENTVQHTGYGLRMTGSGRATIKDNVMGDCAEDCMDFPSGNHDLFVTGNAVGGCAQTCPSCACIDSAADRLQLWGNQANDSAADGIRSTGADCDVRTNFSVGHTGTSCTIGGLGTLSDGANHCGFGVQ